MSKETWTEWILSSYSDSVSPSITDVSTTTAEPESTTQTSSPYGAYIKTGRGGAGNFVWQSDLLPHDLEGQQQKSSLAERRKASLGIEIEDRRRLGSKKRPANIYTGRGGAGNAVALTAGSYGSRDSPRSPSWPLSPQEGPPAAPVRSASLGVTHNGRGGTGNFATSTALARERSNEREEDEERTMEEDLRERSEAEVGCLLKPPEEVFLAVGGMGRKRESGVGAFG